MGQISGYSIVKSKEYANQVRFIVVQGINLERKCYNGEGYEVIYQRTNNGVRIGLLVPARYVDSFNKEVVGKKFKCNFNMSGNVDDFEVLK